MQGATGSRCAAAYGQVSATRSLPPGPGYGYRRARATAPSLIHWEGRLCRFAFEVPPGAAGTVDLGRVRCVQLL